MNYETNVCLKINFLGTELTDGYCELKFGYSIFIIGYLESQIKFYNLWC